MGHLLLDGGVALRSEAEVRSPPGSRIRDGRQKLVGYRKVVVFEGELIALGGSVVLAPRAPRRRNIDGKGIGPRHGPGFQATPGYVLLGAALRGNQLRSPRNDPVCVWNRRDKRMENCKDVEKLTNSIGRRKVGGGGSEEGEIPRHSPW